MKLRRKLRVLALTIGAIGALAALGASPAAAELVPGKFNASTAKLVGSGLTVKRAGGEAKTCELKATTGTASEGSSALTVYTQPVWFNLPTKLECTGGTTLHISMIAGARYDTVTGTYSLRLVYGGTTGAGYGSPYGDYYGGYGQGKESFVDWTNGSGATSSKIKFSETYLGARQTDLSKITLSGSITATTNSGGLLTLSH